MHPPTAQIRRDRLFRGLIRAEIFALPHPHPSQPAHPYLYYVIVRAAEIVIPAEIVVLT
jgi:hypothetical protein